MKIVAQIGGSRALVVPRGVTKRACGRPCGCVPISRRWLGRSGLAGTVSAYLYRIFPKLGITSRAALRDALATVSRPRRDDPLSRLACVVHGVPAAGRTTPRPCLREGGIAKARLQDG